MGRVAFEYTQRLRNRGIDVHVFTPRYREVDGDPGYVHRVPSPLHVGNAGVVPSLFHRLKGFDVIHLHYPFFGGAEPVIIRKAIRKDQKLVLTYHMDTTGNGLKGAMFEAHRRILFPWLLSRADRVLVSSREYAETSALAHVVDVLDRVEIHPFGVDLDRFHPGSEPDVRRQLEIPEGASVIIFVGGLDPAHHFKGLPVLLEALSHMADREWHCIVVGDGSLRPSFEATAAERGCRHRMHFLGNISDEDLPKYYRAADMHVFPSTERAEAFGLVALEAAASGIPSVASDLAGVRSVVLNGETGLLVPPSDAVALRVALESLMSNAELRQQLGFSARKRVEADFNWEPLIAKLIGTYNSLFPI
jgi:glycosyltransferase involved in cell wall biosynthesis